jgi:hypothetical protein
MKLSIRFILFTYIISYTYAFYNEYHVFNHKIAKSYEKSFVLNSKITPNGESMDAYRKVLYIEDSFHH